MYKTLNTSPVSNYLRNSLPNEFEKDGTISNSDMCTLRDLIEMGIRGNLVTDISDVFAVPMGMYNITSKYSLSTDNSKYTLCEDTGLIVKEFECFVVVCLKGYCKITVNLGNRQITDTIREDCGFLMDVGLDHLITSDDAMLVVAKCTLDASMFYYQNIIMFPEKNLLSQFNGSTFILYDILTSDDHIRLLVTNKCIYNFVTGERYDIIQMKYIFDYCKLPMPVIPLSECEFTLSDMDAIKMVDIEYIFSRVKPITEEYNYIWLKFRGKVLYGAIAV